MSPAEALLTALRTLDVRVWLDAGTVGCKAPDGIVPADLAHRIRKLKPELVAVLTSEADEVAWRVAQIGPELLADVPDAEAGICPWCWMPTPGRAGKCVLCALASAAVVGQTKATMEPGDISAPDRAGQDGGDMSSERRDAA